MGAYVVPKFLKWTLVGFIFLALTPNQASAQSDLQKLINLGFEMFFSDFNNNRSAEETINVYHYKNPRNLSQFDVIPLTKFESQAKYQFKRNVPFKVFVHGFLADCSVHIFPLDIIHEYLETGRELNVICFDWRAIANPTLAPNPLMYMQAVERSEEIGEKLAQVILSLKKSQVIHNFGFVHVLGLSLGAHIAGIAGNIVSNEGKGFKIGRITGLDPAGVFFRHNTNELERRLDPTDAQFVDVIHTNGGQLGLELPCGHVDFYPNGGRTQPSCHRTSNVFFSWREQLSGECSHLISGTYFKESIQGDKSQLVACKAESWPQFVNETILEKKKCQDEIQFGDKCPSSARGTYYLEL